MSAIYTLPVLHGKKFGLLISDSEVEFVMWKKGELERIAVFSNDDDGLRRFGAHLAKEAAKYKNASFRILANVIGEDYRVEKTAYLIGKYKTDFHNRRMRQLFRGVSLCMSFVQGREERGRRNSIVLFYGMLTEGKVVPWMQLITRNQSFSLEAVQPVSFVNSQLIRKVDPEWRKKAILLMTVHEKGLLRQTHYDKGHVRFSRVSKISDSSAEEVAQSIRKELERTVQYLSSLKISIMDGLDIAFVCPGNMVGQLRELIKSSEKIRFNFYDASAVAQNIGLTSAMGELGRDSSLSMHLLFAYTWVKQLAGFNQIRYYWMKMAASIAVIAFLLYGITGAFNVSVVMQEGLAFSSENSTLTERRDKMRKEYDEQFGQLEEPPSSPTNITAVAETFRVLSKINVSPGQLIYYFAKAYEKNRLLRIMDMRWYLTGNADSTASDSFVLVQGQDIYQILEVTGEFLSVQGESYVDVANRANLLMSSFDERGDINIQAIELPRAELGQESLGGVLTDDFDVEAAHSRNFRLRIIWKKYDAALIDSIRRDRRV